jgi:hypothetical protein
VAPAAPILALLWAAGPLASAAGGPATAPPPVRVALSDALSGRSIAVHVLREGDRAVLDWTNSLFRLPVTEVLEARGGELLLTSVTFASPDGRPPPLVRPEEVDELYHTGGPFRAEGLARPVRRVVFRVGRIGDPVLRIGGQVVRFLDEVGFGGAIVLEASAAPGPASP